MSIPADTRKFGLKTAFAMITSVGVSLALTPYGGWLLPIAVVAIWLGMGAFVASDSFDQGPVDQRKFVSQIFNLAGLMLLIFGKAICFAYLLAGGIMGCYWLLFNI